jgi:hypothetical protein
VFEAILSPLVNAVKVSMSDRVYRAAQDGAREGLQRFALDLSGQLTLPHQPEETPSLTHQDAQDGPGEGEAAEDTAAPRRGRKRAS